MGPCCLNGSQSEGNFCGHRRSGSLDEVTAMVTHLPGARRNSTASVVLLLGVNVHTAHTPEKPASQSHSAVEVSSKTQIILWICTVQSESQPYSCVKFNSAETLFYVLSKSFPENSLFAKVYIHQTFFNNTRRKCAVQNQMYLRAKFNSAETLILCEVYLFQKMAF